MVSFGLELRFLLSLSAEGGVERLKSFKKEHGRKRSLNFPPVNVIFFSGRSNNLPEISSHTYSN